MLGGDNNAIKEAEMKRIVESSIGAVVIEYTPGEFNEAQTELNKLFAEGWKKVRSFITSEQNNVVFLSTADPHVVLQTGNRMMDEKK